MKNNNTLYRAFAGLLSFLAFSCGIATRGMAQSEADLNSGYHETIVATIKEELAAKEKLMNKEAERMLLQLPNEHKLYDETYLDITLNMEEAAREDGAIEHNLIYSISYNCKNIEGESDDYPMGAYLWQESNSTRAICTLTKRFIEGIGRDYFQSGHPATIRIFSATDATTIPNYVPYNGEYGDFRYCPVTFNNERVRLSVSSEEGIVNNAQLAFIRAQSIRSYIEKEIPLLQNDQNQYEYITTNNEHTGGQYRRSSIELVVHGVFDHTAEQMAAKMSDDGHVDFNIPETEPGSNANTFAIIFANEKYPAPLPSVPYAANDGNIIYKYCVSTLGIPERHIKMMPDATRKEMRQEAIQWIKDITVALNGNANILIYYAGHGTLDASLKPYLMPSDIDVKKIGSLNGKTGIGNEQITLSKRETKKLLEQCISIDSICLWFNKVQFNSITLITDASFDGTQRDGKPLFVPKTSTTKLKAPRIRNNILILSSAAYNKTSYSFDAQKHGFFTYFILKELKHTKGNITVGDLYNHVNTALSYESSLQGKLQQPYVVAGGTLKDSWESLRLK